MAQVGRRQEGHSSLVDRQDHRLGDLHLVGRFSSGGRQNYRLVGLHRGDHFSSGGRRDRRLADRYALVDHQRVVLLWMDLVGRRSVMDREDLHERDRVGRLLMGRVGRLRVQEVR